MKKIADILIDDASPLFDRTGMQFLEFPSECATIRMHAMRIAHHAPVSIRELNLLEQQISELIKNAVKHGNRCKPHNLVQVWYQFSENQARLIVADQGQGFTDIEKWNEFHRVRQSLLDGSENPNLGQYVAWRTPASDDDDGGNALFAAVEFWNRGLVYTRARNCVAACRDYENSY